VVVSKVFDIMLLIIPDMPLASVGEGIGIAVVMATVIDMVF
jgi:hypothetical protein